MTGDIRGARQGTADRYKTLVCQLGELIMDKNKPLLLPSKKRRRRLYKNWIVDIALDISTSIHWRELLFNSDYDERFLISSSSGVHLPSYPQDAIIKHNLQFYVSKVLTCPIQYFVDDSYIIFKFESVEFPEIVEYSGN